MGKISTLVKQAGYIPVLTPLLGRLVTNSVGTNNYSADRLRELSEGLTGGLPRLLNDQLASPDISTPIRDQVFRLVFGLPSRGGTRDMLEPNTNYPNTYQFTPYAESLFTTGTNPASILGNYAYAPTSADSLGRSRASVYDVWDFDTANRSPSMAVAARILSRLVNRPTIYDESIPLLPAAQALVNPLMSNGRPANSDSLRAWASRAQPTRMASPLESTVLNAIGNMANAPSRVGGAVNNALSFLNPTKPSKGEK